MLRLDLINTQQSDPSEEAGQPVALGPVEKVSNGSDMLSVHANAAGTIPGQIGGLSNLIIFNAQANRFSGSLSDYAFYVTDDRGDVNSYTRVVNLGQNNISGGKHPP